MGNGKASAVLYAREGARVLVVDQNLQAAEETKRLIHEEGGECTVFQADITSSYDCRAMVEECVGAFGSVDILHNNVGIVYPHGVLQLTESEWNRAMDVNLKGMFLTCKYALPYMVKQGRGAIVNISSLSALRHIPHAAVSYAASKAGVIALTREVALQYAPKGIRANVIVPGYMNTPFVTSLVNVYGHGEAAEMVRRRDAMCPMGHQGDAWDVAYAALFLASDEAKYVTGITLVVDGGMSCTHQTEPWNA
jgi:NAD(P)-dependent dehydrogenase (short-subunit alcohol dehydrogenase family)